MLRSPKLEASPTRRLVVRLVAALTITLTLAIVTFAPGASAQDGTMTVGATTTYRVDVDNDRVVVEGVYQLHNNVAPIDLGNGSMQHRYFSKFGVAIPQSSVDYVASIDGLRVQAGFYTDGNYLIAESPLSSDLYFGDSTTLTFSYVIPNSGPRGDWGTAQITDELVSLRVWTQGSQGQANVRVILPADFDVDLLGSIGAFNTTTGNGQTILEAYNIGQPREFNGQILARNDNVRRENTSMAIHSGTAVVLSRASDTEWRDFVVRSLQDDLPVLEELLGLPWPHGNLVVEQSTEPKVHGFGGWYSTSDNTIKVGEDLNRETLLHEFSHGWFNYGFAEDRWIIEGLAEEFASRGIEATGGLRPDPTWPDPNASVRLPLSKWEQINRVSTAAQRDVERYHYNASWWVFRQISDNIGMDAFSEALVAYDAHETPEHMVIEDDWKVLFDLLDEHADDEMLDTLFETYVLAPGTRRLEQRRAARERYGDLFGDSGIEGPVGLQRYISGWHFEESELQLDLVESLLPRLHSIEARAAESSIDVSHRWEQFGSAEEKSDLRNLGRYITDDLEELDRLDAARADVLAAADDQMIEIGFEPTTLSVAEFNLGVQRLLLEEVTADRATLTESATHAGIAVTFRPNVTIGEALTEVNSQQAQLDVYVQRRAAVEERLDLLGLTMSPSPQQIRLANHALDEQASILAALVTAEVSFTNLGDTEPVSLADKSSAAEFLGARQVVDEAPAGNLEAKEIDAPSTNPVVLISVIVLLTGMAAVVARSTRRDRDRSSKDEDWPDPKIERPTPAA